MKAFWMSATGQLSLGLVLVAAVFAAFAAGGDAGYGLVTAALVLAFLLLVYFGRRRSDTLDVMSGIGDERAKLLYTRAVAFTGTVMSFVLPIWWLVTVAQGDPNEVLTWSAARSSAPPSSSPSSCSRGAAEAGAKARFTCASAAAPTAAAACSSVTRPGARSCGERVTPYAAGCALCGAELDPTRWQPAALRPLRRLLRMLGQ